MKLKKILSIKRIKKVNKNTKKKFVLKKTIYNLFVKKDNINNLLLEWSTLKYVFQRIFISMIYVFLLFIFSNIINNICLYFSIKNFLITHINYNKEIYINFLISCVSVAGFLIALFYANLSSVFSSKYVSLSSRISKELLFESTNKKYIDSICNYILITIIILLLSILGIHINVIIACITVFMTLRIIIIFIELSRRIFIYSNTTIIGTNIMKKIVDNINMVTSESYCFDDVSFQKYHNNRIVEYLKVLKDLASSLIINNDFDGLNSVLMINLNILAEYSKIKNKIPYDSLWYSNNSKGQSWFTENDIVISTAINTGTSIGPKIIRDKYFLEDELIDINNTILKNLIENEKFDILYSYYDTFNSYLNFFSISGDVEYWSNSVIKNINFVTNMIDFEKFEDNNFVSGLADLFSLLHISILLDFTDYYKNMYEELMSINWEKINYKSAISLNNYIVNNELFLKFVNNIENEKIIEKKLITPKEFIQEYVYMKVSDYYNNLQKIILNNYKTLDLLSEKIFETKNYKATALITSRMIEYNNKIQFHFLKINDINDKINSFDKRNYSFTMLTMESFFDNVKKIYIDNIERFSKVTTMLFFKKYDIRNEQIDFIGELYYQLTFLMIDFIIDNDFDSFKRLYDNFVIICSISDSYIKEIIKPNEYNTSFIINRYTMTTINLMNINGFVIYYSRLMKDKKWENLIMEKTDALIKKQKDEGNSQFIDQCLLCANTLKGSIAGISILNTNIKLKFENFVRNSGKLKFKYTGPFGYKKIDSKDKILSNFSFDETVGFSGEFYEIYLIHCINNYLDDKKYVSRFNWERSDK